MKKTLLIITTLALTLGAASAFAAEMKGGLGFHNYQAPIGIRHWMNDQVGIDLGVGISSFKREFGSTTTSKNSGFSFDAGLPYCLKKWDKVHFILRPGVMYFSNTNDNPPSGPKVKNSEFDVTGEFEAEVMVADNVSVSASHGLGFYSASDDASTKTKTSGIFSIGNGWTQVGFHVYLW